MGVYKNLVILVIFLVSPERYSVKCASMEDMKELTNELMKGYNKYILPIKNQSEKMHVEAYTELRAIVDLDEREERLTSVMALLLFWMDESIKWNETEHHGIQTIHMDANLMWKPRLAVTNVHASSHHRRNQEWDILDYLSSGHTRWQRMETFETSCSLDTTYYPFDVQRCSIEMLIYGSFGKIIFNPIAFEQFHLYQYEADGTWNVTDYYISNKNGSNVTVTYHLERNPRYMIVNFLVPILVLALLNPMVFLLPPDSGERIGYSMTIMLALSVYMTILGDYLPQNSDPIPLMSYTIMVWYLLSATSLFVLFFNTYIYYKPESKPIPKYLVVFVRVARRVLCIECGSKPPRSFDQEEIEDDYQPCLDGTKTENKSTEKASVNRNNRGGKLGLFSGCTCLSRNMGHREMTWHDVGRTIDLFFMVAIYVIKILFAFIFMYMLTTRPNLERIISEKPNIV